MILVEELLHIAYIHLSCPHFLQLSVVYTDPVYFATRKHLACNGQTFTEISGGQLMGLVTCY